MIFQLFESERGRVSRPGSSSRRPVLSSSRPSSSGEPSENRHRRLGSGSGRLSTTQRLQPGIESKTSSFTRASAPRSARDDALRSFELLTIGKGKRKWCNAKISSFQLPSSNFIDFFSSSSILVVSRILIWEHTVMSVKYNYVQNVPFFFFFPAY